MDTIWKSVKIVMETDMLLSPAEIVMGKDGTIALYVKVLVESTAYRVWVEV
jgi:hypothetical protein